MTGPYLDVVDPPDCDEHGRPLDWLECRCITGHRGVPGDHPSGIVIEPCPVCHGYRSLEAAALASIRDRLRSEWGNRRYLARKAAGLYQDLEKLPGDKVAALDQLAVGMTNLNRWAEEDDASFVFRCQGCWHPLSEGTLEEWSPRGVAIASAEAALRRGEEPDDGYGTHFSRCDAECDHGGSIRILGRDERWHPRVVGMDEYVAESLAMAVRDGGVHEASWRPIAIRTLGHAHDLRQHKLRLLCLRCWVAAS